MIIQTTSGNKFGGFTSTGWNSERGKDIYDQKAFCFSINISLKKISGLNHEIF